MCGYMSQFDSVQNKIRNGYLFKVCFCRLFFFKLFLQIISLQSVKGRFFELSNSASQFSLVLMLK